MHYYSLFCYHTAKVRFDNQNTLEDKIQKGLRKECLLSLLLFNVYSKGILKETFSDLIEEISINGEILNILRFADDTVIVTENNNDLQNAMERCDACCNEYDLRLAKRKLNNWSSINRQLQTTIWPWIENRSPRLIKLRNLRKITVINYYTSSNKQH